MILIQNITFRNIGLVSASRLYVILFHDNMATNQFIARHHQELIFHNGASTVNDTKSMRAQFLTKREKYILFFIYLFFSQFG